MVYVYIETAICLGRVLIFRVVYCLEAQALFSSCEDLPVNIVHANRQQSGSTNALAPRIMNKKYEVKRS